MATTRAMLGGLSLFWFGFAACSADEEGVSRSTAPTAPDDGPSSPAPGSASGTVTLPDGGTASISGDPNAPDAPEEPPIAYAPFDVNHVLETGQSNAVANNANPIASTAQPFANLMFDVGVIPSSQCDGNGCLVYEKPTSLVPLVEGDRFFGNDPRETISSGMANQISVFARESGKDGHAVLASLHGRSGNAYYCLRKGGCDWWAKPYVKPFDDGMRQVEDGKALAEAARKSYVVRAVTTIHGETDHYSSSFPYEGSDGTPNKIQNYADALVEWQADYDAQVKLRTGQTIDVPLLVSQMNAWNDVTDSDIPLRQYEAHLRAPKKVVLVAPTYMLLFQRDCLHFTASSQELLGEYFAKAYARIVFEGRAWEPLRPKTVTRAGNVLTIQYLVPKPPLVLDTAAVTDPGNYGFEFRDSIGTAITGVAIDGADKVKITLSGEPAPGAVVRYAATATPATCPGPFKGPRGNLKDSDARVSRTGKPLPNWGIAFELPVK